MPRTGAVDRAPLPAATLADRAMRAAPVPASLWLPISAALLVVIGLLGGAAYERRRYRRRIGAMHAALQDANDIEEFSCVLIDTIPIALCVLTRTTGQVVHGNRLAREWLGALPGQALPGADATRALPDHVLTATGPGVIESFPAGDGRSLRLVYAPTRFRKQNVLLCAFSDLSSHIEIEQALARARHEAHEADQAKSNFLATISHEIRTPLYGVLGTLELLDSTGLSPTQQLHLQRIQASSATLLQLISDILDIAYIDAGQLALVSNAFSPRELIESGIRSFATMAAQKGLLLFACIDDSIAPHVTGDRKRLRQILHHLIGNAIKFTDSGHVIVRLRAQDPTGGQPHMTLQVVDTGIGVSREKQPMLFNPFYKIDGASQTVRGVGIGLTICSRLAALMNSELRVTSQLGLGSSFSLNLALAHIDGPAAITPDLRGIRVHIRSPHRELTDNVCRWLGRWGARATPATCPFPAGGADDVLLDLLPDPDMAPVSWAGPYLCGGHPGARAANGRQTLDGHDLDGIGFAIQRLLRGDAPPVLPACETLDSPLRLRVLVAEDNPINQATLRHQLEQLGCHVTVASDGAEALTLWHRAAYDVLLTDINMPKLDGYELTRALRQRGITAPIFGITANAMRDEEERGMAAGMNSWLVKPIELSTLRHHLRSVPAASRANPPSTAPAAASPGAAARCSATEFVLPVKYHKLFLETMNSDLDKLNLAISERDVLQALQTMHRMRGALVMVKLDTLSTGFEAVEAKLQRNGQDKEAFQEAAGLAAELRTFLDQV